MEVKEKRKPYEKDGIEYPSVTQITGLLGKGDALTQWAVNCAVEYIGENALFQNEMYSFDKPFLDKIKTEWKNVRSNAANIGKEVHDLITQYIKSGEITFGELLPEVRAGFDAFLLWEKENVVKWLETEKEVIDTEHGYAGRLDAIALMNNHKIKLIDFKTGNAIYDEFIMQVSAYAYAYGYIENAIDGIIILRLDKKTGLPEAEDVSNKYEQGLNSFLALLDFFYKSKKRRLKNNPFVKKYWPDKTLIPSD